MKNAQTFAEQFKAKAKELMPHHEDLQDLSDLIDNPGHIDEIMFRKSEYIGGMAAVIIELVSNENKK